MQKYSLDNIDSLEIDLSGGPLIYLYGDLGAGKTTLSKHILERVLGTSLHVNSPTYTYYNNYPNGIYHFDLYRVGNYDEFVQIGGEEILENQSNVILVEWPEIIEGVFIPDIKISLSHTSGEDQDQERDICIEYKS